LERQPFHPPAPYVFHESVEVVDEPVDPFEFDQLHDAAGGLLLTQFIQVVLDLEKTSRKYRKNRSSLFEQHLRIVQQVIHALPIKQADISEAVQLLADPGEYFSRLGSSPGYAVARDHK